MPDLHFAESTNTKVVEVKRRNDVMFNFVICPACLVSSLAKLVRMQYQPFCLSKSI